MMMMRVYLVGCSGLDPLRSDFICLYIPFPVFSSFECFVAESGLLYHLPHYLHVFNVVLKCFFITVCSLF